MMERGNDPVAAEPALAPHGVGSLAEEGRPEEWFLVPLHVIDEAVQRIRDGSITNVVYDPKTARLVS